MNHANVSPLALPMTSNGGCLLQAELTQPFARFLSVGLGLLYLGKQEEVEATLEVSFS